MGSYQAPTFLADYHSTSHGKRSSATSGGTPDSRFLIPPQSRRPVHTGLGWPPPGWRHSRRCRRIIYFRVQLRSSAYLEVVLRALPLPRENERPWLSLLAGCFAPSELFQRHRGCWRGQRRCCRPQPARAGAWHRAASRSGAAEGPGTPFQMHMSTLNQVD